MTHEEQIIKAVKKIMPSVVSITAAKDLELIREAARQLGPFGSPNMDEILKSPDKLAERGIPTTEDGKIKMGGGSGFLVHESGIILTNRHVVMDPQADYSIVTNDEKTFPVKVLARDPIHDVAVLKVAFDGKLPNLPVAGLSEDLVLDLGQSVVAIGNALGEFKNSVSTGVVSGLSRFISAVTDMSGHQERLRGLIQTDAAINPGNSGGPLIDLNGDVIGINVAIVFGAQNIGFAIPIKKAKKDLDDIRTHGRIRRPFLGIRYIMLNKALSEHFGVTKSSGAFVLKETIPGDHAVIPDSAADKAGIKEGDIITACNGKTLSEKESLEDTLEGLSVGDTVTLDLLRDKKKMQVKLNLEEHK